ncbi:MAG TPA: hypothetical protein VF077_13150 [Nitrospiraceae bacterium]
MPRLKDRQRQIPNGFKWRQPETGFVTPEWASFDTIVHMVQEHRRANPFLAKKHNWSTDPGSIGDEVDTYNALLCEKMGWQAFISNESEAAQAFPKAGSRPGLLQKLRDAAEGMRKLEAGSELFLDWENSGQDPVVQSLAESRAAICATCPKNEPGNFTRWFTVPAAGLMQKRLERRKQLNLSTSYDDKLGICSACLCPLKLKAHTPLNLILDHLPEETKADLDPRCWITSEASSA